MIFREGFACAGPWLIEHVHEIEQFPREGGHATVNHEAKAIGGVFGVIAALRRLQAELPLYALGLLGEDDNGHVILDACHELDVDTFQLLVDEQARTASATVMQSLRSGRRTSFHSAGANDLLDLAHFDFRHCLASWFHLHDLAQLAILGDLDRAGMPARALFQSAQGAGMTTSLFCGELHAPGQAMGMLAMLDNVDYLLLTAKALAQCTGLPAERAVSWPRAELNAAAEELVATGGLRSLAVAGEAGICIVHRAGHCEWQEGRPAGGEGRAAVWCAAFIYDCYCRERQAVTE
ncbi:MAG: hypothetical protein DKINENOH_05609 [bacterium]|nr:hypothetical protein [bacterium]